MKRAAFILLVLGAPVRAGLFYPSVAPTNPPWPGGVVPYQFETQVTPAQQAAYLAGLREWELAGNIRFVPRTTETNYVLLQFDFLNGVNTLLYTNGSSAVMHVDRLTRGQVAHEAGHAIGLQHEHVRADRDTYLTVDFTNILPFGWPLYQIDTNETPHGPYDFESIMHYGPSVLSVNPGVAATFTVPPPYQAFEPKLGFYYALSPGDRAAAAHLYGPPTNGLTNVVTTTEDGGAGSLRAALYFAQDHPGTTISFNLSTNDPGYSNGVWTIHPSGHLPVFTSREGFTVDGGTQPGFSNHPVIAINGSRIIPEADLGDTFGFLFYGANCRLLRVCVQGFADNGIYFKFPEATNNTVAGCHIGTDARGLSAVANGFDGVAFWFGAQHNLLGGTGASERNVISGNGDFGVLLIHSNTHGNAIMGNYIGAAADGSNALPNHVSGVAIYTQAHQNVVGGAPADAGNLILGHTNGYGVFIADPGTTGNVVRGNTLRGNHSGIGLLAQAGDNRIDGNRVVDNADYGLVAAGPGVARNIVANNALCGNASAIGVFDRASGNVFTNNVLATNDNYGAILGDPGTASNVFAANVAVSNYIGIGLFTGARDSRIENNVLSDNRFVGLAMADDATSNNVVIGNVLESNDVYGLALYNGPKRNHIGPGNRIAHNTYFGLLVADTNTQGNAIRANSIFSNGFIGIQLAGGLEDFAGVTANDALDADSGPNGLQNHPTLTNAAVWGGATRLTGLLRSTPSRAFALDFFRGDVPEFTGHGEGGTYVGSATNVTSAAGDLEFILGVPGGMTGVYYTATATDLATGDTSEFGTNAVAAAAVTGPAQPVLAAPVAPGAGVVSLAVSNDPGWSFRLQDSTNLLAPWRDVTNYLSAGPLTLHLLGATNLATRHFRAVSP